MPSQRKKDEGHVARYISVSATDGRIVIFQKRFATLPEAKANVEGAIVGQGRREARASRLRRLLERRKLFRRDRQAFSES